MTELSVVQASSYTDVGAELSLTELGRVVINGIGWMVDSGSVVHTEDGVRIGTITAISQVMEKLGWITYSEPRQDFIQSGYTAINWGMIPSDIHGDFESYTIASKFQYIIEVSYDLDMTQAIALHDAGIWLSVVKKAVQNGIDGSLLDSLTESDYP